MQEHPEGQASSLLLRPHCTTRGCSPQCRHEGPHVSPGLAGDMSKVTAAVRLSTLHFSAQHPKHGPWVVLAAQHRLSWLPGLSTWQESARGSARSSCRTLAPGERGEPGEPRPGPCVPPPAPPACCAPLTLLCCPCASPQMPSPTLSLGRSWRPRPASAGPVAQLGQGNSPARPPHQEERDRDEACGVQNELGAAAWAAEVLLPARGREQDPSHPASTGMLAASQTLFLGHFFPRHNYLPSIKSLLMRVGENVLASSWMPPTGSAARTSPKRRHRQPQTGTCNGAKPVPRASLVPTGLDRMGQADPPETRTSLCSKKPQLSPPGARLPAGCPVGKPGAGGWVQVPGSCTGPQTHGHGRGAWGRRAATCSLFPQSLRPCRCCWSQEGRWSKEPSES